MDAEFTGFRGNQVEERTALNLILRSKMDFLDCREMNLLLVGPGRVLPFCEFSRVVRVNWGAGLHSPRLC